MNFQIFEQSLILLPLMIGAYLNLSLLKLPSFSLESAYLFGAVAAAINQHLPFPLVCISGLAGGLLVGICVAFLNQICRLPFLLAAIITNGFFHGCTHYVLGSSVRSFHPFLPINELSLIIGINACIILFISYTIRSQLGYSWAIYGNNPHFFSYHQLAGRYVVFSGVMVGHGLAGLSGFLFAQANGFVDMTMQIGVLLLCLTALMIGKVCIQLQRPHLLIPMFGIVIYFCVQQFLLHLGLNLKYFNTFQAIAMLSILLWGYKKNLFQMNHLGV